MRNQILTIEKWVLFFHPFHLFKVGSCGVPGGQEYSPLIMCRISWNGRVAQVFGIAEVRRLFVENQRFVLHFPGEKKHIYIISKTNMPSYIASENEWLEDEFVAFLGRQAYFGRLCFVILGECRLFSKLTWLARKWTRIEDVFPLKWSYSSQPY